MKKTLRSLARLRWVYIGISIFLVALSFLVFKQIEHLVNSSYWAKHSTEVSLEVERIGSSLRQAEASHRGFLLTHDSSFLQSFHASLAENTEHIKNVQRLTQDNATQQKNLVKLKQLDKARIEYFFKMLEADNEGRPTAEELLMGKTIMDSVLGEVERMMQVESKLFIQRYKVFENQSSLTPVLLLAVTLIALAILVVSYYRLNTSLIEAKVMQRNLQSLVMEAPVRIAVLRGPEHVLELANNVYLQSAIDKNIVGKPIREAYPEYKNSGYFEMLDLVYKRGETFKGSEAHIREDTGGGIKDHYYNFDYRPSFDVKGNVDGVIVQCLVLI